MREIYGKEKLSKLKPYKYKRLLAVEFAVVCKIEKIINNAYNKKQKKGGRSSKISFHEMIVLFLLYIKESNTMEDYAFEFKTSKILYVP